MKRKRLNWSVPQICFSAISDSLEIDNKKEITAGILSDSPFASCEFYPVSQGIAVDLKYLADYMAAIKISGVGLEL
jgi:hypothetical protein